MDTLKRAAKKFKILDHVPNGICIIQKDYRVLFWNDCLENWTGISKNRIVGTDLAEYYPHLKEPRYYSRIQTVIQGGPPTIFSSQLHKQLFPPWHVTNRVRIQHTTVSAVPTFDGEEFFALFAVEDVTELTSRVKDYRIMRDTAFEEVRQRQETENELRQANRKIQQQQKAVIQEERLKVLLQMAGATAHELNQPLMSLLGNLELFELFKHEPAKAEGHLLKIRQAGQQISETVKKIQTIQYNRLIPHDSKTTLIDLDQKKKILSIEDSEDDYKRLKKILRGYNQIDLMRATGIQKAMLLLAEDNYDIILSDYQLEDGTAKDLLLKMTNLKNSPPVVVITGKGDEMLASQMLKAGAYDYLPKNRLNNTSLMRAIKNTLEKVQLKMEIEKVHAKMAEMTTVDDLTKLYNRRYFEGALTTEFERARRYKTNLAFLMLDLDHFKSINDTYGHRAGDRLLAGIGGLLKRLNRKNDIACRYGGEEFVLLLPNTNIQDARLVGEKLRKKISEQPFGTEKVPIHITVSVGIASINDAPSSDQLLQYADKALYESKSSGRNRVTLYQHN